MKHKDPRSESPGHLPKSYNKSWSLGRGRWELGLEQVVRVLYDMLRNLDTIDRFSGGVLPSEICIVEQTHHTSQLSQVENGE